MRQMQTRSYGIRRLILTALQTDSNAMLANDPSPPDEQHEAAE